MKKRSAGAFPRAFPAKKAPERAGRNERSMEKKRGLRTARRWRHLDAYEIREEKTPDGQIRKKAVYRGGYLLPEHGEGVYARARRRIRFLTAGAVLSLAALLSAEGSSVYDGGTFALLPAAAAVIPAFYGVLGAVRMPETDARLQEDAYRFAHVRVRRSAGGTAALAGLALLLILAVLVGKGRPFLPADAVLAALAAAACLCALGALLCGKRLKYLPEKPGTEEKHEDPADGV